MYYLNAFNEMLRRRQQQNNMMGGGQDYGVGTTAPSGPMGLGQAQDRSGFRDALSNMSPFASAALGMVPGFNLAKAVNYGMSQYDKSQLSPADAAMAAARQGFQASEKSGYGYGPAPEGTVFENAHEGAFGNSAPASQLGGGVGSPNFGAPSPFAGYADDSNSRLGGMTTVGAPIGGSVTGTALESFGTLGGGFGGADYGGGLGGFGSSSNEGVGIGERGDLAHGGLVTPEHLHGPKPPGEDDGYTALKKGEYVITKAAVEKYGKRMMDAINNGTFR